MEITAPVDELQFVVFQLGKEEFAVEVSQVQEIIQPCDITRLPRAPEFIRGIINLRGKILTVIHLGERLSIPTLLSEAQRIIITTLDGRLVGMIVDSVTEVLRVPTSALEPPPPMVAEGSGAFLRGIARVGDRLLILIDLSRVLSTEDVEALAAQQDELLKGEA